MQRKDTSHKTSYTDDRLHNTDYTEDTQTR